MKKILVRLKTAVIDQTEGSDNWAFVPAGSTGSVESVRFFREAPLHGEVLVEFDNAYITPGKDGAQVGTVGQWSLWLDPRQVEFVSGFWVPPEPLEYL